ncbi:MAG: hypothetical protein ACOYXB_16910 [Bacteroidota bacterium]
MRKYLFLPLILILACSRPEPTTAQAELILTAYGPEDMVTDLGTGKPTLLISCSARRDSYPEYGEILRYFPDEGRQQVMVRSGEPANIRFRPHGIYLDTLTVPERLLVISHENEESGFHPVLIYTVTADTLFFSEMIDSPLLNSPNSLVTGPSGEIFVINDSGKRGSTLEKILGSKRAGIVRFEKPDGYGYSGELVASRLSMPAGINRIADTLYVSDARANELLTFTITPGGLDDKKVLARITGPDNIRPFGKNLLIACHTRPFAFIRHVRSASNLSPVEIISLDPQTGNYKVLFSDDGSTVSAGSVAVALEPFLYIGQVFENRIVKLSLRQPVTE